MAEETIPEVNPADDQAILPSRLRAWLASPLHRTCVWVVVCAVLGCLLSFWWSKAIADFLHFEHLSGNVRSSLFSERPATQSRQVSIVAIDDRELAAMPYYSPLDRGYIADVVQKIALYKPRRIVFDLVFDRHSDPAKDAHLIEVLKDLPVPVVLGYADRRTPGEDIAYETAFLNATGRPYGFANLLEQTEEEPGAFEVTDIPPSVSGHCSLSAMAFDPACRHAEAESRPIDWLLRPKDGTPNFATLRPRDIPTPTAADALALASDDCEAKSPPALSTGDLPVRFAAANLHCRVVFLGGILSYEDRHKTPMANLGDFTGTEDRQVVEATKASEMTGDIPGLLIQAFATQQLFDGRVLEDFGPVTVALMTAIASLLGAASVEMTLAEKHPRFFILLCSLVFMGLDILVYKLGRHVFPGNLVVVAFALSLFINLLRLKSTEEEHEDAVEESEDSQTPPAKQHGPLRRLFHGISHIVMELMG